MLLFSCQFFDFPKDTESVPEISYGTFIDERDNQTYKWLKIDSTYWMAENLAYLPKQDTSFYVYGYDGKDVNIANDKQNYRVYGCLYNWESANKCCPKGWRLPTREEWEQLMNAVGGKDVAGTGLREKGLDHWTSSEWGEVEIGIDSIGFGALPGVYCQVKNGYNFDQLGISCAFWGEAVDQTNPTYLHIWSHQNRAILSSEYNRYYNSVRCVKTDE